MLAILTFDLGSGGAGRGQYDKVGESKIHTDYYRRGIRTLDIIGFVVVGIKDWAFPADVEVSLDSHDCR